MNTTLSHSEELLINVKHKVITSYSLQVTKGAGRMINTVAKDEMKRILLAYQKLELLQPATIPDGVFINDFTEIWSPRQT